MISVLLIEDDRDMLGITRTYLTKKGAISVHTAISAGEALGLLRTRNYDVIVSDYQMPDMNGIELLKDLRAAGNDIPFIIFTGRSREQVVIEALNNGADFYLQKGDEPKAQFIELENMIIQANARKKAENFLRESIRRLSDIISFLPDATLAIDRGGNLIAWNRAMEELTGVPAHQMLGQNGPDYSLAFYGKRRPLLIDLIFSTDEEVMDYGYTRVRRKGTALIAECTAILQSGKKTLWGIATPLYDERGALAGAIGSIRDISRTRDAEKARLQSEVKFRGIFENSPVAIAIFDENGRLSEVNSPGRELGFPCNGVDQYNLFNSNILTPGQREALSRGEVVRFEITDGQGIFSPLKPSGHMDVLITPLFSSHNESSSGYIMQVRNIQRNVQNDLILAT
ncbi:MAG: response regulator [Methanomicrobiales archaeon]|nr:response regulator [Methanomicrobiales archaeon]